MVTGAEVPVHPGSLPSVGACQARPSLSQEEMTLDSCPLTGVLLPKPDSLHAWPPCPSLSQWVAPASRLAWAPPSLPTSPLGTSRVFIGFPTVYQTLSSATSRDCHLIPARLWGQVAWFIIYLSFSECSPSCPQTHDSPASASRMLGL
jgi:hypothetical protein